MLRSELPVEVEVELTPELPVEVGVESLLRSELPELLVRVELAPELPADLVIHERDCRREYAARLFSDPNEN